MDNDKLPNWYRPDPDLQGLKPLMNSVLTKSPSPVQSKISQQQMLTSNCNKSNGNAEADGSKQLNFDEFPALGSVSSTQRKKGGRR